METAQDLQQVMEEKLARTRVQVTLKLDNQKNLALILAAVEDNIAEQNNARTPVAYFVSFLALLEQAVVDDEIADAGVAAASAYMLDLVLPAVPPALLREKFAAVLTKLAPVFLAAGAEALIVRSAIGAFELLLLAQDTALWLAPGQVSPQRALVGIMELALDPRPKVRKRAQEAVRTVLANPPPGPSATHVALPVCADLALLQMERLRADKSKQTLLIHALQLVAAITLSNAWPAGKFDTLCDALLAVSRTLDQYLVAAAFAAFDGLFLAMAHDVDAERFAKVLLIIFDLRPNTDDTHLAAAWLAVVASGVQLFGEVLPVQNLHRFPTYIAAVSECLAAESSDIYLSAGQCLMAIVSEGFPDSFLVSDDAEISALVDRTIAYIGTHIERDLLAIKYQHATKEVLEWAAACIAKFRNRASPFLGVLEAAGQWRTNELEAFPHNKQAEDVIAAGVAALGPEAVLARLPLNFAGSLGPGRAWMLPLLRDNVRNASLAFFQRELVPVAAFFAEKAAAAQQDSVHSKIFATLADQTWALLPPFCDLPRDLPEAFTDDFAAGLADRMYADVALRVTVCHALRLLVESNVAYAGGALADDPVMQKQFAVEQATENIALLALKAANLLLVLFNIFSSTAPELRGFVLETIDAYLGIVPKDALSATFDKVCGLLKQAMDEPQAKNAKNDLALTMMDLVVAMAKYVPAESHSALLAIFLATVTSANALMQKRLYRILSKLSETDTLGTYIGDIENVFINTTVKTHTAARAARLQAMQHVVAALPQNHLHFIPAVLQEVIMSTKDVNERSRELAYSLLIAMGRKMAQGGVVQTLKVPGFDAAADTEASLTQFCTMLGAGLAAQSPHMISAAITAISCVLYEFKDEIPQDVLLELALTVELFLTHNSREIAKAAIGFVKVEVLALPEDIVRGNLQEMLTKLMRWSHEHKGHFRLKVKHIVERLVRKFGAEAVEEAMPEDDRKLVANIRKSRARAKKKEGDTTEKRFMLAYEEAVHDLDSDLDDNDDAADASNAPAGKKRQADKYIMNTGDEPLNLLDRQTLAHISLSKPRQAKPKRDVEMHNGKIVFKDMLDKNKDPLELGLGIDAYLDAVKQAPVRGQKNKLKFKKTKNDTDDWSDDEAEKPQARAKKDGFRAKNKSAGGRITKPKQKFKARKKL